VNKKRPALPGQSRSDCLCDTAIIIRLGERVGFFGFSVAAPSVLARVWGQLPAKGVRPRPEPS
jgi:hypothetical protein